MELRKLTHHLAGEAGNNSTMVTSKEWEGCPYSKTPEGLAMLDLLKDLKLCVGLSLVVRYYPDKNANDPKAADIFKEVTFFYNILFDPDKRRQFDTSGFEPPPSFPQFFSPPSSLPVSSLLPPSPVAASSLLPASRSPPSSLPPPYPPPSSQPPALPCLPPSSLPPALLPALRPPPCLPPSSLPSALLPPVSSHLPRSPGLQGPDDSQTCETSGDGAGGAPFNEAGGRPSFPEALVASDPGGGVGTSTKAVFYIIGPSIRNKLQTHKYGGH
ncbi:hypothetical protein ACLB2K_007230 [Fragaria x ananassa]